MQQDNLCACDVMLCLKIYISDIAYVQPWWLRPNGWCRLCRNLAAAKERRLPHIIMNVFMHICYVYSLGAFCNLISATSWPWKPTTSSVGGGAGKEQSFTVTVCESQSIDQDHHTKLRDRLVCIVQCVNNVSVNKSTKCPALEAWLTGMQLNVVST